MAATLVQNQFTMSTTLLALVLSILHSTGDGQTAVNNNPVYGYASSLYANGLQAQSFVRKSNYFISQLNFDAVPGMVLVGGKGNIYLLSDNLTLLQTLSVGGCGRSDCSNNLVHLVHQYSAPSEERSNTVVVCWSASPVCSLVNTSGGNLTVGANYTVLPPSPLPLDPTIPSFSIFYNVSTSRNTNFFAVSGNSLTFHSFNPNDPESLNNNSLKFGFTPTNNVFNVSTWFSSSLVIVDVYKADYPMRGPLPPGASDDRTPDEHKYLFVFVREQDPLTLVVTNKLVRLCQNDPGSMSAPNGLPFPTTLLKANISCQSSSGPLRPNLLQGVVFSRPGRYYPGGEWVELMYGAFTDYTGYSPRTSICVYRANDSNAFGYNNRGVFDIFRSQVYDPISSKTIANGNVECNTKGRTDLQSQNINLVLAIQQYNSEPLALLSDVVVTKMAVDQPCVLNGTACVTQDVLFLGTSTGSVLKIVMSVLNGSITPIISEDIMLGDPAGVRQIEIRLNQETGMKHLYVNTDNGIYRLPLERCSRFLDCSGCVASRDPYCVWNTATSRCEKFSSDLNITMIIQNITIGVGCPEQGVSPSPSVLSSPTITTIIANTNVAPVSPASYPSTFSLPVTPTPYVMVDPTVNTEVLTPWVGNVSVAPFQLPTMILIAALAIAVLVIIILLVAIGILSACLCQLRSKRCESLPCESPLSVAPLAKVPVKGNQQAPVVSANNPMADGHIYGVLETNTYDHAQIYAPLEVIKVKNCASDTAPSTPHEYSSIHL